MLMHLPDSIARLMPPGPYTVEEIGLSGASVLMMEDRVLKIEARDSRGEETVRLMRWLEGKVNSPRVLAWEQTENRQYLLMSRVTGTMACDEQYMENSDVLLENLGRAMRTLWQLDTEGCPRDMGLDVELGMAWARVEGGLVDLEEFNPGQWGLPLETPEELLCWLEENRPLPEGPVFSHGDFCLPNILLDAEGRAGYIDLGDAGLADPWRDIAQCWRSLKNNFGGVFGGKIYPEFDPDRFLNVLGVEKNREKLRYYLLLQELF